MGIRRRKVSRAREQLIRELLNQGLSVPEVARKAGVSPSKVYEIRGPLGGRRAPEIGLGAGALVVGRAHEDALLGLARGIKEELQPPLWQCPIRDFGEAGRHCSEGVAWENSAAGIRLMLRLRTDADAERVLLWECFCDHLRSGGYSWLLGKLDEWEQMGGQELQGRTELLRKMDDMLKERLASPGWTSVREARGQPTPFFAGALVAVLVDGLALEYSSVGEPGGPIYNSYCGEFQIGSASTPEAGRAFQLYHKKLRAALDADPLTEGVRGLKARRDDIASAIEKGLSEMLIRGYVPGECKWCPRGS